MSSVLVYHNFGLGDHIVLSPIVREYCRQYDRVGLFCVEPDYPSVAFLFRDLPNLYIHQVPKDTRHEAVKKFWYRNLFLTFGKKRYGTLQKIFIFDQESVVRTEKQWFKRAGVPYEKKWSAFHIERDAVREQALWLKINPPESFIFVHDDERYPIDNSRLPNLPVVRVTKGVTDVLFDYCGLIEKAAEIHVMDSSFMHFIEVFQYHNSAQKLVIHRYTRHNPEWLLPVLTKPWTILN